MAINEKENRVAIYCLKIAEQEQAIHNIQSIKKAQKEKIYFVIYNYFI